jgi:DNA-binding transcriptional regulator YiaG
LHACEAFLTWCESGRAIGDRTPDGEIYLRLFPGTLRLSDFQHRWRQEGAQRSARVQRGEARRLSRKELGRRYRERLKIIWELDPQRRAFELERKRRDAMRRERERGRRPLTPERASARCKLAWQRRRENAAAAGLAMSSDEIRSLRERLGRTQKQLASAIGRSRTAIEHWEVGDHHPSPSDVKKLRRLAAPLDAPDARERTLRPLKIAGAAHNVE